MTVQAPDFLLCRGEMHTLVTFPLEPYLARLPKRLRHAPMMGSTACWRGYIALWEIRDGMLWLVDVKSTAEQDGAAVEIGLDRFLSHRKGPIPATWFSDDLVCPEGRLRSISLMGIGQQDTERTRVFDVSRGRVTREWLRHNPPAPLVYVIEPDGTRTRHEPLLAPRGWVPLPDTMPDEFPDGAPVEPWRLWADPERDILPPDEQWPAPDWQDVRAPGFG